MRNFGEIELEDRDGEWWWRISAEPHVMIRVKNVMRRTNPGMVGTVYVRNSPEVCRDLEWFVQRYPMEVKSPAALASGANQYRATMEAMERIQSPGYVPRSFDMALPPRHYQAVAAEAYLERGSQLLADHVGLGKSVTALAAMTDERTLPSLVVCQAHLPKQWKDYAGKFMPMASCHIIKTGKLYQLPPADIYICTYHKLAKWAEVLCKTVKSVVFDEVQELRRVESQKYTAARAIRDKCKFAQGLSATPVFNYGAEIWNVLQVLSPDEVGTEDEFKREWCDHYRRMLRDPNAVGAYLRERGLMLRRSRKDVGMDLPPVQTIVETVEYTDKVLHDLDTVATELAHRILAKETDFHAKGEAAREFDMRLRQATGIAKAPHVAAFVRMLVEDGEKVVLTGWHRAVYDIWKSMLEMENMKLAFYTGTESPQQKQRSVEQFMDTSEGGADVFVMSLRSGSGLDGIQQVCSTIVHGELDWSPGVHEQCTGRIYRDGQEGTVFEYYLVSDGGSDPTVADVLGIKRAQAEGLLNLNASGLVATQCDDTARVKRLAEDYLTRKHGGSAPSA